MVSDAGFLSIRAVRWLGRRRDLAQCPTNQRRRGPVTTDRVTVDIGTGKVSFACCDIVEIGTDPLPEQPAASSVPPVLVFPSFPSELRSTSSASAPELQAEFQMQPSARG